MLGPGPGPPHRNLELAGRAVVCTANNQTFKSLTKPSAGPPVREVQAQHCCLHPRQGEIDWLSPGLTLSPCQEFGLKNFSLSLSFFTFTFPLPGVWFEEPAHNPSAGQTHLWVADVRQEPEEGQGDGAADQESTGGAQILILTILCYFSSFYSPSSFSLSSLVFYRCRTGAERIRLSCRRRISRGEDRVQPTGGGRQLQDWGLQGEQ